MKSVFAFLLLLAVASCGVHPAFASDAARPEAMIGFFASPSPANASATSDHGSLVRASWYGGGERLSRTTASGARFYPGAMTAAHRSLPFGTQLLVSLAGRSIVVTVNDRGPAAWTGRALDLSRGAADALGMRARGSATVRIARL